MELKTREPAVSGKFYPGDKNDLNAMIHKFAERMMPVSAEVSGKTIMGGIVPHAGYIYSARHATPFFQILSEQELAPDTVLILCPNHYGFGPPLALDSNKSWKTPLGKVDLDHDFYPFLHLDIAPEAHQLEHSAEVMLPLLQFFLKKPFAVLPISMRDQTPQTALSLAKKILKANEKLNKNIAVIASSDFSHYISPEKGKLLDDKVLEKIMEWDTEGVFTAICQDDISVCGFGPIMTLMEMAKHSLKNPGLEILSRGHSGETYPSPEVVHYISAVVYEKS
ncbi:MAG: AmmeMemoRadiSam system protein B [Bacteroidales bacterium]|nr:AmmeMemoRadiSam system protein B [Bacteroidales bacterium]